MTYGFSQEPYKPPIKVVFFYSPSCHNCIQLKDGLLQDLEKEFKNKIIVEYRDIADIENYKMLLALREKYRLSQIKNIVPAVYLEGHRLLADREIYPDLRRVIISLSDKSNEAGGGRGKKEGVLGQRDYLALDLLAHFKVFKPLAVISAGLVDGINPCAFTVIVFFISFLALQGYRRPELIVIGLAFIFAVFLT